MSFTLGTYTAASLGLILTHKVIEKPEPILIYTEVPGRDGVVDFTESFGDIKYKNRKITLICVAMASPYMASYAELLNSLHGRKLKLEFDEVPDWTYEGRVSVSDWTHQVNTQNIEIEIDAFPYRRKVAKTTKTDAVTTSKAVVYVNSREWTTPQFTTTAEFTITFGTYSATVSAGTFTLPAIVFVEGNNSITYTGTGSVTVEYQEGSL